MSNLEQIVKTYCKSKKIRIQDLSDEISVPLSTFNKWIADEKIPKTENYISLLAVIGKPIWDVTKPKGYKDENIMNIIGEEKAIYKRKEITLKDLFLESQKQTEILKRIAEKI